MFGIGLVELIIIGIIVIPGLIGIVVFFALILGRGVRLGHAKLACPHCGQETSAQPGKCQHCGTSFI